MEKEIKKKLDGTKEKEKIIWVNEKTKFKTNKYYNEERLDFLFKRDVYSLGILVLHCIEEIPITKRCTHLDEEYIQNSQNKE